MNSGASGYFRRLSFPVILVPVENPARNMRSILEIVKCETP
jgi:hypothetical protein